MAKADKEHIHQYLLKQIDADEKDFVKKTVENFAVSRSTVYNYVKGFCEEGVLEKCDFRSCGYGLVSTGSGFVYENKGLKEDAVFNRDIAPLLAGLPQNVLHIWKYAFTEMMNNAIEHSQASAIFVNVSSNLYKTSIVLADDGIGIFENIRDYMQREKGETITAEECAAMLFAGKFTTARESHSGEGIFFTSHMMDCYMIQSENVLFSRDSFREQHENLDFDQPGTVVIMSLVNQSRRTTREVFDLYSDFDRGFYRTNIPIAHFFLNGYPVSRSEARRLTELLGDFEEIILDYADVEEIGQAFAHELYVVWQGQYPKITLTDENACEAVSRMIAHVKNTK